MPVVKNDFVPIVTNDTPSEVTLRLSTEKKIWTKDAPIIVKFSFENTSDSAVKLSTSDGFMLNYDFDSPVSLTKVYDEKAEGCQDDLTPERFSKNGGIGSAPMTLVLEKGEKKEYSFDLRKVCWHKMISSVYPNQEFFSLVKPGKYKLYLGTGFDTGRIIDKPDHYDERTTRSVRTERIEIEVK